LPTTPHFLVQLISSPSLRPAYGNSFNRLLYEAPFSGTRAFAPSLSPSASPLFSPLVLSSFPSFSSLGDAHFLLFQRRLTLRESESVTPQTFFSDDLTPFFLTFRGLSPRPRLYPLSRMTCSSPFFLPLQAVFLTPLLSTRVCFEVGSLDRRNSFFSRQAILPPLFRGCACFPNASSYRTFSGVPFPLWFRFRYAIKAFLHPFWFYHSRLSSLPLVLAHLLLVPRAD